MKKSVVMTKQEKLERIRKIQARVAKKREKQSKAVSSTIEMIQDWFYLCKTY